MMTCPARSCSTKGTGLTAFNAWSRDSLSKQPPKLRVASTISASSNRELVNAVTPGWSADSTLSLSLSLCGEERA